MSNFKEFLENSINEGTGTIGEIKFSGSKNDFSKIEDNIWAWIENDNEIITIEDFEFKTYVDGTGYINVHAINSYKENVWNKFARGLSKLSKKINKEVFFVHN